MRFRVADIQPNPFRHMDRYPIRRDKVESLKESIRTTEFWDNIVARLDSYGKPQIAYGHHRLVALREEYAPEIEIDLIIRKLNDDQMLKIMARENMQEWGSSVTVEHETVRATVEAYANGQINLNKPPAATPGTSLRYAPSFIPRHASDQRHPYTAWSVAEFLGWLTPGGQPTERVRDALDALELIEEGILGESDFSSLGTEEARAVAGQARRVKREREVQAKLAEQVAEHQRKAAEKAERQRIQAEAERKQREGQAARAREDQERQRHLAQAEAAAQRAAQANQERTLATARQQAAITKAQQEREQGRQQAQKVARHVSQRITSGQVGFKHARDAADEVREKEDQPPPDIDAFALRLATQLNFTLDPGQDNRAKKMEELIRFRSYMSPDSVRDLQLILGKISERAENYRERLNSPEVSDILVEEILELSSGVM